MDPPALRAILSDRLGKLEERLQAACRRAGRARAEVTLVAVTKSVSVELAALLPELGVVQLGENRPQELWRKAAMLPADVHWHLIGHCQRNKIERTLPLVRLVHSVDSVRLLTALDKEAGKQQRSLDVLLEVNASREANKQGFAPETIRELPALLDKFGQVQVRGLMTMAAFDEEPERCRPTFATLRQLRDSLRSAVGATHRLDHLSMGMSNDFEVAIEEGATLVRIGTALWEGVTD